MVAAQIPKTACVAKDQLKYNTILAINPVVPNSLERLNENLDSAMVIVWFKITLITCILPSL